MTTNNEIQQGFYPIIQTLDLPTAYPGVAFTPPASGAWLEIIFLPNDPLDDGLADDAQSTPMGMFRVNVCNRPGVGLLSLGLIAAQIAAALPKGRILSGMVRVSKKPREGVLIPQDDRLILPITIEYIG